MIAVGLFAASCTEASPPPTELGHTDNGPVPFLAVEIPETSPSILQLTRAAAVAADQAEEAVAQAPAGNATGNPGAGHDEPIRAVQRARLKAATEVFTAAQMATIRPRSVMGVGLLPGDANEVCGVAAMIGRFGEDPAAARAFSAAEGIGVIELGDFLRSLRAGYLIDNVTVLDHRRSGDQAERFETVLATGTPVLVDADGLPRVQCRSASPLLPFRVELGEEIVETAVFADRVVSASISPDIPPSTENLVDGVFTNQPDRALGLPDRVGLSLGDATVDQADQCPFSVTLEFTDNRLVDQPGNDLQIIELGRFEPTLVFVGSDLANLRSVGQTVDEQGTIDIAAAAEPGEEMAFVRLCDGPELASEVPGSDIDAVAALSSVPAPAEDGNSNAPGPQGGGGR